MSISWYTLLILAKIAKDKEAQKALDEYNSLRKFSDEFKVRVWVVGGSYRVGLTR